MCNGPDVQPVQDIGLGSPSVQRLHENIAGVGLGVTIFTELALFSMGEDRSNDPAAPASREEKKRFDPDSLIRAVIAGPLLEKIKVFRGGRS